MAADGGTLDVAQLVQAATDAARAAAEAVAALKEAQSSRGTGLSGKGFSEASKVIRQPDPFGSENHEEDLSKWQDFTVNFKAWLFYGDSGFESDFHRIETMYSTMVIEFPRSEPNDVQERCKQLYNILTGILRGKPLRLLRQTTERNGFEVWRKLVQLFSPKTKSRSISLLAALMNIPSFSLKDKTLMDQILGLERLRTEYTRSSGSDVADDLMLSILVKSLPKALQTHIQLQMTEHSSYAQVRELVLSYETVTTTWSAGRIHSELGILPSSSTATSSSGPAPMEIDRFEKGKKGRGKGKMKSKDSSFSKGKAKGKFDKGKGKSKQDVSKPRMATSNDQCLHCGKYGHFKRDCWKLHGKPTNAKNVNQVSEETTQNTGSASSGISSSAASTVTASASGSVRLFSSYVGPIVEELPSDDDGEIDFRDLTMYESSGHCNVVSCADFSPAKNFDFVEEAYMSACAHFDISCSDDDGIWTVFDGDCIDLLPADNCFPCDCIRAVGQVTDGNVEVVIDSGADGSVLPLEYAAIGHKDPTYDKSSSFIDAQGKPIFVREARIAEVQFGSIVFKERFIIAPVTSPLISMGRLLRDGWCLQNSGNSMSLARNGKSIPVHFKRNSLCAHGVIRMLSGVENNSTSYVRSVVLGESLSGLQRGWIRLSDSVYGLRSVSPQHVDTTYCPSETLLWLRTTLVCFADGTWELEEYCQSISDLSSRVLPFQTAKPVVEVITIAHDAMVPPEALGFSVHEDVVMPANFGPLRASSQSQFSSSASASASAPAAVPARPNVEPPDELPAAAEEAELPVAERVDVDYKSVMIEGVKMDSNTPLRTLRGACESLGLSKTGGKAVCLERLWKHLESQELIAAHAAHRDLRGDGERPVYGQPVPAEPSEAEKAAHYLTHYPFAKWCELCIANRSQQDGHSEQHHTETAHSCISFDFGYASRKDDDDKLCALFIHDRNSGAMHVVPTPQKGGKYLNYLCTEFCRFIVWCGHDTIALKCDQEPSTLSLLEAVKKTCRCLGIRVLTETVGPASHASNGAAEVTVKLIRQQANLLIQQIEQGCGIADVIGCQHPLYAWSLLHACFLHNRFVVRQGHTAYELCADRSYTGRLAMYGETVLGYLKQTHKGAPQWTKGVWLGKTLSNDVHIIAMPGAQQLFVTRSVRRLPPSKAWDGEMIAGVEASPWQFNYASLGSQLVLAKRIAPPTPSPLTPAPFRDLEAEAVLNAPPTPEERPPHVPRSIAPPSSALPAGGMADDDERMDVPFEAGVSAELGASAPRTPQDVQASGVPAGWTAGDAPVSAAPSAVVHPRDVEEDVDRPAKHQRILAVFEHEDESNETQFESEELDELECYEFDLDEHDDTLSSDADLVKQLCLPFSTLEPSLPDDELLKLDLIADQLEIKRLRNMGVLIPSNEFDFKGEKPKMLTTRMVRTWRDKVMDGSRVWLRRSGYVAREFAWLSPDRQDLFSPASSVLTVRLLPCLYMKWRSMGYVLCSIDIGDVFLTVDQKELTEVVCTDASGAATNYVLGRVLPGQRNGSQMWHESFSKFLQNELKIHECEPYPCLLKSPQTECALLLHVDDVLCLVKQDYLRNVLEPTLRKKYKISLEVLENAGDELTFLKRRHILLSEYELGIQSHPKHLEKLFEMMKINRNLKPKHVPVHQLLDEPDETNELPADKAKIYRSCIGILLYIASDFVECQYAIRGLAQTMSRPTVQAFICLRHLCLYLLGCVDHCTVMKCTDHQGLLHYTPNEYTMEVYSDSDWAKHRSTRRSVSSGHICLFGNVLYSSSRTQKTIALSSAEAEIYAGVSACCDGKLMQACIQFLLEDGVKVEFTLNLDNSAAKAFFFRSGVGRIRHISVRVLWLQREVKLGMVTPSTVSTRDNTADLGTKRLSRERMRYLMNLCKVYDLSQSEYVGKDVLEKVHQSEAMSEGIKLLRNNGIKNNSAKSVMRILLLGALGLPVDAMETSSTTNGYGIFSFAMIGIYITVMCLVAGLSFFLGTQYDVMKGEYHRIRANKNLRMVLKLLNRAKAACTGRQVETDDDESEEVPSETSSDKGVRYMNAEMCEVSDPELWMEYHHGHDDESPDTPDEERTEAERSLLADMRTTNEL